MTLKALIAGALAAAALACAAASGAALAQDAAPDMFSEKQYQDCMAAAREAPEDGYERALTWQGAGGGMAAGHCAAVALIGLGDYAEAAGALERMGDDLAPTQPALAAELFAQAGQAWTMADDVQRAFAAQGSGLSLAPDNVDLLVDRAISNAALNDYRKAITDLNAAQKLAPGRADILTYRAGAWRYLDDLGKARADADAAVKIEPGNAEALLERGIIRRLSDDPAGARADWLQVVTLAAGTPTGDAAQVNLEKLDLKSE